MFKNGVKINLSSCNDWNFVRDDACAGMPSYSDISVSTADYRTSTFIREIVRWPFVHVQLKHTMQYNRYDPFNARQTIIDAHVDIM